MARAAVVGYAPVRCAGIVSTFLVDSDVVIWAIRREHGVEQALATVIREDAGLLPAISAVTVFEVLQGMRPGSERRHHQVLNQFECVQVTGELAAMAATIAREQRAQGRPLNMGDALIAATAVAGGLTLVTYNSRHFEPLGVQLYEHLPPLRVEE